MSDDTLGDWTLTLAVDLAGVTFLRHEWGVPWQLTRKVLLFAFLCHLPSKKTPSVNYETVSTYATTCMYTANLPRNLVRVPGLSTIIICVSSSTVFAFRGIPRLLAGREEKRKDSSRTAQKLCIYIWICSHERKAQQRQLFVWCIEAWAFDLTAALFIKM